MTNFRIGDIVKRVMCVDRQSNNYFNGEKPFDVKAIVNGCEIIDPNGCMHYSGFLELVQPPSEIEAVKLLLELGYKVEEPPKPMTGEIVVVRNKEGAMRVWDTATWNDFLSRYKAGWDILAKVKWTEGEGI
jgi:hypothetical protein